MLNELHDLARSIDRASIDPPCWHKDYGTCPKSPDTYRVFIDENSRVVAIEEVVERANIQKLRKWEKGNGYSFPAFNVPPLFKPPSDDDEEVTERLRDAIEGESGVSKDEVLSYVGVIRERCSELWSEKKERITSCLQERPKQLWDMISPAPEEFAAVAKLIERACALDALDLETEIESALVDKMIQEPNKAPDLFDSLLVTTRKRPPNVSLVLEVADWASFPYPVHHEKTRRWINQRLWHAEEERQQRADSRKKDAFGNSSVGSKGKLPKRNLPILGPVILRAMSTEAQCQKRYGKGNEKSFPIGTESRRSLAASMEWIAASERQGRTWQNVSGACEYDSGVLFAYPSELKEDPPEIATLFGGGANQDKTPRFEDAAEHVIHALAGLTQEHPNAVLRVFVLVKADKARTKVLVSRRHKPERIIEGSREWRKGCFNIPPIAIHGGNSNETEWITPIRPFPSQTVECLNLCWLQGGTRSAEVKGLDIGDGLSLLLDRQNNPVVRKSLHLAVSNGAQLLMALGHSDHRRDGSFDLRGSRKFDAARMLPSILGLLLFKLHILKGEYMNNAPFLVGRMLSLADVLHKEYCQHNREGNIPPKLIGNSLMPVATDNPQAGLARLRERIMVYQGWANTAQGGDYGLAKWALARMGEVAQKLSDTELPDSTTDAAQAQMLLGYLASWKNPKTDDDHEDSEIKED